MARALKAAAALGAPFPWLPATLLTVSAALVAMAVLSLPDTPCPPAALARLWSDGC